MHRFKNVVVAGFLVLAVSACSGAANNSASNESSGSESAAPAESAAASSAPAASMAAATADGATIYSTNCSSCHQANGQGTPGAFPPLAGNSAVTGDPKTVIHIVKYGLSGKIEAAGKAYNGQMPSWGSQLSDGDIAAVVTYVRSSWGNKAGAVTTADVGAVSK